MLINDSDVVVWQETLRERKNRQKKDCKSHFHLIGCRPNPIGVFLPLSLSPSLCPLCNKQEHMKKIRFTDSPGGVSESTSLLMTVSEMCVETGLLTFVACGVWMQSDAALSFTLCSGTYCFCSDPTPNWERGLERQPACWIPALLL